MQNFNFPYFSRDIAEFWRRWHISLSTWFKDYLYIPLGGSRGSRWMKVRNTFIIFLISGFWHGANWTFIAWGALNALYFLPMLLTNSNRRHLDTVAGKRLLPSSREVLQMASTFLLTVLGWIFFRAENLSHAFGYLSEIFSPSLFELPDEFGGVRAVNTLALVIVFMLVEWLGRNDQFAIEGIRRVKPTVSRWVIYLIIIFSILLFGNFDAQVEFIYFQF